MRQATRHFMAEAAIFAVLFCVLFWVMPVQSHAADTAGKVTGFIGETYYKNGKVQKKKAVFIDAFIDAESAIIRSENKRRGGEG